MEGNSLLKLAELDAELAGLRKQEAELSSTLEIPKYQSGLSRAKRKESHLKDEVSRVRKRARSLEMDLEQTVSEIRRMESELYGGRSSSSKELASLQAKIEGLKGHQATLEEQVLEGMMQIERLEEDLAKISHLVERYERKISILERTLAEKQEELRREREELTGRRRDVAARISPELLRHYEAVARGRQAPACVVVRNGVCCGCNLPVATAIIRRLKVGTEPQHCENCGRIICLE